MRRAISVFLVLLALASVAACSRDQKQGADPTTPATTTKAPPPPILSPLTGLPLPSTTAPKHPIYVVKVDNTRAAYPQVGVKKAEIVVEELVEGGLTRLAAMYYARTPDEIGPVRSMRATDIGLVKPAGATIIASGGALPTIDRIRAAGIPILSEDTGQADVLVKALDRRAPYNRILDLRPVAADAKDAATTTPYLPFGSPSAFRGDTDATTFTVTFAGGAGTQWAMTGQKYQRQNGLAADGEEFKADNVLVLRAPVGDAGYLDPAGNPVPETKLEGKGRLELFHGGKRVKGRWYKSSPASRLGLTTLDGQALTVPAGRTWIELVPDTTGAVTVTG